jgi:hypothetical protein
VGRLPEKGEKDQVERGVRGVAVGCGRPGADRAGTNNGCGWRDGQTFHADKVTALRPLAIRTGDQAAPERTGTAARAAAPGTRRQVRLPRPVPALLDRRDEGRRRRRPHREQYGQQAGQQAAQQQPGRPGHDFNTPGLPLPNNPFAFRLRETILHCENEPWGAIGAPRTAPSRSGNANTLASKDLCPGAGAASPRSMPGGRGQEITAATKSAPSKSPDRASFGPWKTPLAQGMLAQPARGLRTCRFSRSAREGGFPEGGL